MSSILTLVIVVAALALGLALAYLPMRILMATMARNVRQFIQRTRDRRSRPRDDAGDRRKVEPEPEPPEV